MHKGLKSLTIILSAAAILYSCGQSPQNKGDNSSSLTKEISRHQFNGKWPFTIEKGTLKCVVIEINEDPSKSLNAVILEVDGRNYAINGTARTWATKKGYLDLEEIWAYDTAAMKKLIDSGFPKEEVEKNKTRISVHEIIEEGLKLRSEP